MLAITTATQYVERISKQPELLFVAATGVLEMTLEGHKGPIYDLDWHRDGLLLSASGDCTVRVWSMPTKSQASATTTPTTPTAVLQHPSYVYAARFHPNASEIIATVNLKSFSSFKSIMSTATF